MLGSREGVRPGSGADSQAVRSPEVPELSEEDVHLLRLLAKELPVNAVAARLGIGERTLRRRTRHLCDRLGVGGRIEAAVWAAKQGLL